MTMTSVSGHLLNCEFGMAHRKWWVDKIEKDDIKAVLCQWSTGTAAAHFLCLRLLSTSCALIITRISKYVVTFANHSSILTNFVCSAHWKENPKAVKSSSFGLIVIVKGKTLVLKLFKCVLPVRIPCYSFKICINNIDIAVKPNLQVYRARFSEMTPGWAKNV
jgi:hypothetical protein